MSLLVIVAFAAIGALVGFIFSLPSGGLGAAPGGGHGELVGYSLTPQHVVVAVGMAGGLTLAFVVVWGMWRNHVPLRWFGATSVSALAFLLACLIQVWRYPFLLEVAVLLVPVLCGAFLYAESKDTRLRDVGG